MTASNARFIHKVVHKIFRLKRAAYGASRFTADKMKYFFHGFIFVG